MRLPHSITCIFFFSFILQHCLFTIVVFDDDNRGRKPKWFVVNQMIPFRWPSRSLEWGYVLISQFHSDCPMAQTQWHISGLNCTLHISVIFLHCTLHICGTLLHSIANDALHISSHCTDQKSTLVYAQCKSLSWTCLQRLFGAPCQLKGWTCWTNDRGLSKY